MFKIRALTITASLLPMIMQLFKYIDIKFPSSVSDSICSVSTAVLGIVLSSIIRMKD